MSAYPNEEKYPLLFLYVEENGKRSEFPRRVVFANRGRGKDWLKGAAAIVTQWPDHLSSCWVVAISVGTVFAVLSLMSFAITMVPYGSYVRPHCVRDYNNQNSNTTIHLSHVGDTWTMDQLRILILIAETYPEYDIRIINFEEKKTMVQIIETKKGEETNDTKLEKTIVRENKRNDSSRKETTKFAERTELEKKNKKDLVPIQTHQNLTTEKSYPDDDITKSIKQIFALTFHRRVKRIIKPPQENSKTITMKEVTNKYPKIQIYRHTFKNYFTPTPLKHYWMNIHTNVLLFASRIQELWQYGGVSFYLPVLQNITSGSNETIVDLAVLKNIINDCKTRYETLEPELVSIDNDGLHMATQIPCHAFFGEMIMNLVYYYEDISIPKLIQKTLDVFCKKGFVDSDYCRKKS